MQSGKRVNTWFRLVLKVILIERGEHRALQLRRMSGKLADTQENLKDNIGEA